MKNSRLENHILRDMICLELGSTVGDAKHLIRKSSFKNDLPVFILSKNKLIGFVNLLELIRNKSEIELSTFIKKCESINYKKTRESAVNYAISNQLNFVPVENEHGDFIGVFDTKSVIETLRSEHIDDLHKLAGIKKEFVNIREAVDEAPIRSVWHRLPWLLVGLVGSFVATFIMSNFESVLNENISLSFFIPGIVYLADAIGTQTETIVIRGISLSWSSFKKIFFREFMTGLLIGLILGTISFLFSLLAGYAYTISIVILISIVFAGTIATSIGLLLPALLNKFGLDPAFGSGPLATVIQDVLSILIYFAVSIAILKNF